MMRSNSGWTRARAFFAGGLALVAGCFLLWYAYSPVRAVDLLVDAAMHDDTSEISHRVDLESVRESLVRQLASGSAESAPGSLARIGEDVTSLVARPLIDAAVTPQTIARAVRTIEATGEKGEVAGHWEIEREGIDSFVVRTADSNGAGRPIFRFRRAGLGWVLSEHLLVSEQLHGA